MNEKLTAEQRDWIYNYFYDVMSLDTFVGSVASLENFLTAHIAEDEDMCQCFTCQGSGKWASGYCPDSENPAHTTEDEAEYCACGLDVRDCGGCMNVDYEPPEDEPSRYQTALEVQAEYLKELNKYSKEKSWEEGQSQSGLFMWLSEKITGG